MDHIIKALFLFAEHDVPYSDQCLDLVRHIECGDRALFTQKAKTFLTKHINESPHMPDEAREQIMMLIKDC